MRSPTFRLNDFVRYLGPKIADLNNCDMLHVSLIDRPRKRLWASNMNMPFDGCFCGWLRFNEVERIKG